MGINRMQDNAGVNASIKPAAMPLVKPAARALVKHDSGANGGVLQGLRR